MWATRVTLEGKTSPSPVKKLNSFLPLLHFLNLQRGGNSSDSFQPSLESEARIIFTYEAQRYKINQQKNKILLSVRNVTNLLLRKPIGHHVSNSAALVRENLTKWGEHLHIHRTEQNLK